MTPEISPPLRKLLAKMCAFLLALLLVFIVLAMTFTSRLKSRLAEQLADSFRAPLISGDTRSVLLELSRPALKDFHGAEWVPDGGSGGFFLPVGFGHPNSIIYGVVVVPVFFDEHGDHRAGLLRFYHNRWSAVPLVVLIWMGIVLLSIPAGYVENNRLGREYDLLLQLKFQKSYAELAAQVAHDIRSPLAALEVVSGDVAHLPQDNRILIRSAIGRIRDIANSLLDGNKALIAGMKAPDGNGDSSLADLPPENCASWKLSPKW